MIITLAIFSQIKNSEDVNIKFSDGISRLGLGLESRLETHFCESRSRSLMKFIIITLLECILNG